MPEHGPPGTRPPARAEARGRQGALVALREEQQVRADPEVQVPDAVREGEELQEAEEHRARAREHGDEGEAAPVRLREAPPVVRRVCYKDGGAEGKRHRHGRRDVGRVAEEEEEEGYDAHANATDELGLDFEDDEEHRIHCTDETESGGGAGARRGYQRHPADYSRIKKLSVLRWERVR